MKAICCLALVVMAGCGGHATEAASCADGLEVKGVKAREVWVEVNPSQLRISGTPENVLRLRCELPAEEDPRRVGVGWWPEGQTAMLRVRGGGMRNQKFHLEVPERMDLVVRVGAGDVSIRGVEGNKDVELTAGNLKIQVARPGDYRTVDASVWVGEIRARMFRTASGGFFRSVRRRDSGGKYTLRANVRAGELTLE